jgi:DNA-binding Lrp family transcriptional regulator
MIELDAIDHALVALLRTNARLPVSDLAKQLNVSRGTVRNRLLRLEAGGVIVGYTVQIGAVVDARAVRAWMSIALEGSQADAVIRALRGEPSIAALHSTNGRWDVVAELRAPSLEEFDRLLARIRLLHGIARSETSLLLSTFKV